MSDYQFIKTDDGSHSLLVKSMNETYHSRHGAMREAEHVFILHGLMKIQPASARIQILEVGFGTGLNALLTLVHAHKNGIKVTYDTIEKYPLPASVSNELNYPRNDSEREIFRTLHTAPWDEPVEIAEEMILRKRKIDIDQIADCARFDLVYYDAFAPRVQPNIWTIEKLELVAGAMKSGALLTTYCAQGQFRRNLTHIGLEWAALEGPPGKREMTLARKP